MLMTSVREESICAYHDNASILEGCADVIMECIKSHPEGCTRKQVSVETGICTATVSGIVTPRIVSGELIEAYLKKACPVTGRRVNWIHHPDNNGQRELFA